MPVSPVSPVENQALARSLNLGPGLGDTVLKIPTLQSVTFAVWQVILFLYLWCLAVKLFLLKDPLT